VSGLKFAR